MTFAEKIKKSREDLLMTQCELAAELGVSNITVCRWETGKTKPSMRAKKAFRELCERKGLVYNKRIN